MNNKEAEIKKRDKNKTSGRLGSIQFQRQYEKNHTHTHTHRKERFTHAVTLCFSFFLIYSLKIKKKTKQLHSCALLVLIWRRLFCLSSCCTWQTDKKVKRKRKLSHFGVLCIGCTCNSNTSATTSTSRSSTPTTQTYLCVVQGKLLLLANRSLYAISHSSLTHTHSEQRNSRPDENEESTQTFWRHSYRNNRGCAKNFAASSIASFV